MRRFGLVLLLVSGLGCAPKAKNPAEAYARFSQAVHAGDGGALFDALDPPTRWAYLSLQKFHREAYDIVLSNYPEGSARERELHRFQRGATATSARELFKAEMAPALLPMLKPLAVTDATIETAPSGNEAAAVLPSGGRVALGRGENGGWGFAGLAKQALEQKTRAYHDLELVRASAADYERAAARAAK
ncbi:MAG TPA: hypothetical protein VFH73_10680 [Polyangia bacterium]|nr:hypothetical protein [Polyangia bacterium]